VQEINLYHLLRYYATNWLVVLAFSIAGIVGGYIFNTYIQKPIYKSSATLIIRSKDTTSTSQNSLLINNYIELMKSRRVIDPVISKLRIGTSYAELVKSIEVTSEKNSEVVKVSIGTGNPRESQNIVQNVLKTFISTAKTIYGGDNITIIDTASYPNESDNINKPLRLVIAGAAGLLGSLVILFFVYDFRLSNNLPLHKENIKKRRTIISFIKAKFASAQTALTRKPAERVQKITPKNIDAKKRKNTTSQKASKITSPKNATNRAKPKARATSTPKAVVKSPKKTRQKPTSRKRT
jgi:capsular polysaccharide biosynthesis protein